MEHHDVHAILNIFSTKFYDATDNTIDRAGNVAVADEKVLLPNRILNLDLFYFRNFNLGFYN